MSKPVVETQQTLKDLRDCFRKWDLGDLWEMVPLGPERSKFGGAVVRYYRAGAWQTVRCESYPTKAENLRQCFLLLDRLRIAEASGVQYSGLSSSKALVPANGSNVSGDDLVDAYGIMGVAPDDPMELIKGVYKRKCEFYHPDKPGGDAERFKRLTAAYERICEARGGVKL